jgi:hypothetical protein
MPSQFNIKNFPGITNPALPVSPASTPTNAGNAVSTPRPAARPVAGDLNPTGLVRDLTTGRPVVR